MAPVGWRGERTATRAWRAYRRATALRATVAGTAPAPAPVAARAPVAVREVELAGPLPDRVPTTPGGAQVLVRLHGRPLGVVPVDPGRSPADVISERLGPAVDAHLAADGLPPMTTPPAGGLPGPWPCAGSPSPPRRAPRS